MGIFEALLVLGFVVLFHECGHFILARACQIGVEVFSLGFGTKLFKRTHNNTEYALSLVPLGGYVSLKQEGNNGYLSKPLWQKSLVLLGGPLFNFLLAFVLCAILALLPQERLEPIVGQVMPNMPATSALKIGDRILTLNDTPIKSFEDLQKAVINSKSLSVVVRLQRGAQILNLPLTLKEMPTKDAFNQPILIKVLGIKSSQQTFYAHYNLLEALQHALAQCAHLIALTFQGLIKLITGVLPLSNVNSVVGIVGFLAHQSGLEMWLLSVGFISINLGLLNLLPIPLLDGGQLALLWVEKLSRYTFSAKQVQALNALGFAFLGALMGLGLFNDLVAMFAKPA
ncbi:RIP metalloprotease RseP [Helicobacter ailurogastricus]|uniref:RIP metalloprotease RseP n=1 Tax=Helicobacter ailurogastricus TaxID=1578720 RepID=UPI00244D8039|nr:RIP metalloprotease RseP [Helicobacter ailurogastricus]GMB91110.1 RIP metalloprotease RseP [Helicobacter ailurogastricus]